MLVETDRHSGFCRGVIRAVDTAEDYLDKHEGELYSLGAIVHNEEELSRLRARGLVTLDASSLSRLAPSTPLLIRAHGEPPETYSLAEKLSLNLIDCTCPVVLKLQKDVRAAAERMRAAGGGVVIFGKTGHPEVIGLVGHSGGFAKVVQDCTQLRAAIDAGEIRKDRDIELFSQTTMSPEGYSELCSHLRGAMNGGKLIVHETICRQVASRHKLLEEFAKDHDVIVFISGKTSSNGKVLYDLCRSVNERTYHVASEGDLDRNWFRPDDRVGVCGATSTPRWLLDKLARAIENLQ